jgi:hypothetical protein
MSYPEELQRAITSMVDMSNKILSANSKEVAPHLTDDEAGGNLDEHELRVVRSRNMLGRYAKAFGANRAAKDIFWAEAAEWSVTSKSKNGFAIRALRSVWSQSQTSIKEEKPQGWGFPFGKSRNE